ncbi:MAG: sodium-dependent transporter [Cytophagales bacterium]|nr:sodium-dependent transporter [Cytophagales bacterium]
MAPGRSKFSNKFGFIAAAAGSAVGLGNIWKFPFEVGKGGGSAFLIIYLLFCFVLCYPILVTEIAIGRRSQKSAAMAFRPLGHPEWSIIGILGVFCGILILSFYNIVAGWVLGYFVEMLLGNFEIGQHFGEYVNDIAEVGGYTIAFLIATAYIVSQGITKGIEKASKILMPVLIAIILVLTIYALTLDGATEGIVFYLIPDLSKLNLNVIYRALGQSFFSLSLGLGALMTYGSYLSRKENIVSAGAMITVADVGIAFLAGLMIFPFVFSQGIEPEGGAGLIFMTMPGIFESMGPTLGIMIGSLFFLLLAFAALTSTISLMELPVAYLVDKHKVKRKNAVWYAAALIFLLGIPSMLGNGYSGFFTNFITYIGAEKPVNFMDFVTDVASNTLLPFGGLMVSIFAIYVWKRRKLFRELSHGHSSFPKTFIAKYIGFSLQYICPLVLGAIFVITILEIFFGVKIF